MKLRIVPHVAAVCLAFFGLLTSSTLAQEDVNLEKGLKPFGSYQGGSVDSISMVNGTLTLHAPFWSHPQRGDLSRNFELGYDYRGWEIREECSEWTGCYYYWWWLGATLDVGDWSGIGVTQRPIQISPSVLIHLVEAKTADGSTHSLVNTGSYFEAIDTTGIKVTLPNGQNIFGDWALDRHGRRHATTYNTAAVRREDRNGNQFAVDAAGHLIDTVGRDLTGSAISTADFTGCSGPLPIHHAVIVQQPGFGGGTLDLKYCYVSFHLEQEGDPDLPLSGYSMNKYFKQSIVLPDGSAWGFEYVPNEGMLQKITFPTGGSIAWTWGWTNPCGAEASTPAVTSRTVDAADGTGPKTWNYAWGVETTGPGPTRTRENFARDPLGNETVYTMSGLGGGCSFYETEVKHYQGSRTSGTLLKTVKTDYIWSNNPLDRYSGNRNLKVGVVPIRITTIWPDGKQGKIEKDHDAALVSADADPDPLVYTPFTGTYGLVLQQREYDHGQGAPGAQVRRADTAYLALSSSNYRNNNLLDLVSSVTVRDGAGTQKARTEYLYDQTTPVASGITTQLDTTPTGGIYRGNQTSIRRWRNTDGAYLTTTNVFFDTGMLKQTTDPGGHVTSYTYSATFAGAYPTQVQYPTTGTVTHIVSSNYDFNTGLVTSSTDENNQTTTFAYDNLFRITQANQPDGGQVTWAYTSSAPFKVTVTGKITPILNLVREGEVDGLGRLTRTRLLSDPEGTVFTDTTYDALGRTKTVTNPYRSTGDPTYGLTENQYDALSRVTKVIPPDGTATSNNVTTVYAGPTVTVTDQAGKVRKSETDALGRLIRVWEPDPAVPGSLVNKTRYFYDTLDNLTCVLQLGAAAEPASCTAPSATYRPRTFTYNSLSQLLTAVNPESGTISYTYDSDGNVLTKVAPKPNQTGALTVTTTYTYDELHRLKQKSYNDGATATVKYAYDAVPITSGCTTYPATLTITNGIGRRTAMCDASGATAWSYDAEGAVLIERRSLDPGTRDILYTYNLDGSLASVNYTGRVVTYTPSGAGRTLSAVDLGNNVNYATTALYAPHGALSSLKNGVVSGGFAGITTTNSSNNRLQPSVLSAAHAGATVLSFSYNFDQDAGTGVKNNGNVVQIANNRDTTRTQNFTYDELNRIKTAKTPTCGGQKCTPPPIYWGQSFTYDIWGNLLTMAVTQGSAPTLSVAVSTSNRITNAGFTYDAAGNLTNSGSGVMTYDAENRLVTAAGVTYTYDGDGKRVKKSSGKLYWTGVGSDPLYETDLAGNNQTEYIYFGGKRVARRDPSGAVFYYFSDHLGSASVVTSATGMIVEESDYYPFGGERVITNSDPNQYKFTGKERDAESGLDYFIARHYSSNLGRFLQPDEFSGGPVDAFSSNDPLPDSPLPYADITNPQSLNKYSYTWNNPLRHTDPNGHCAVLCVGDVIILTAIAITAVALSPPGQEAIRKAGEALGSAASSLSKKLEPYTVGTAADLKGQSEPGDAIDIHHVPQAHPSEQTIEGYDRNTGPAIALPEAEHEAIPVERGPAKLSPADQLQKDLDDLRTKTEAPESKVKELERINNERYPETKQPEGPKPEAK